MLPFFLVSLFFFICLLLSSSNGLPKTNSLKVALGAILNCNSRTGKEGRKLTNCHLNNGRSLYLRDLQGIASMQLFWIDFITNLKILQMFIQEYSHVLYLTCSLKNVFFSFLVPVSLKAFLYQNFNGCIYVYIYSSGKTTLRSFETHIFYPAFHDLTITCHLFLHITKLLLRR